MSNEYKDEVEAEIEFHLQETVDALMAEGMPEAAARQEAARRYGDRQRFGSAMRAARKRPRWSGSWAEGFRGAAAAIIEELRFAARSLRRSPGYTITAILTVALVSGANLTMLGVADGLIFRPLKYLRDPGTVHRVYWQWRDRAQTTTSASTQFTRFVDVRRDAKLLSQVAVFADRSVPVGSGDRATPRRVAAVSASYFDFFDAQPVSGRFFTSGEDTIPRGADVAVLGYRYWRTQMNSENVVGSILRIGDIHATIVGVAPEGFDGLNDGVPPAAFVPITTYAASTGTSDARTYFSAYKWGWAHVLVRRAPGASIEAANHDATRIFRSSWPQSMADNQSLRPIDEADPRVILSSLRPGNGPTPSLEARTSLWLVAVAAAVLLIGCANVANLSLTRALRRRREITLKRVLGISSARLIAAGLMEALMLAICGGIAALAVAQLLRSSLAPVLRSLQLLDVGVLTDPRTLAMTAGLVALTAVVIAVMPAFALRRLPSTGIALAGGRTTTAQNGRLRGALVAVQAGLSVVLLIGAALFVRSLMAVHQAPLGYDADRVLVVNRFLPAGAFDNVQHRILRDDLVRRAATLPQVESAAWMSSAPFLSTSWTDIFVDGGTDATALGPFTFQATSPGYFRTMGTRVIEGRAFTPDDGVGAPEVAVVSQGMARTLWPGQSAIGACFRMREATGPCRTVIGVAEDIVQRTLEDGPRLHYYVPIEQYPRTSGNGLLVRLKGDSGQDGEAIRSALLEIMPAGSYLVSQPLAAVIDQQRGSWRMGAAVLTGFGLLALIVAAVGLYGGVGYDIAQRRREWAVRMALGARRGEIVSMIVGRSVRLVLTGILPGLLIAAAASRWIRPLLFHTSAIDPVAYSVVALTLVSVAVLASVIPALRASAADPNEALKAE